MWFKIPYKFSLQSMHKQKKYLGKTFFWGDGQAIQKKCLIFTQKNLHIFHTFSRVLAEISLDILNYTNNCNTHYMYIMSVYNEGRKRLNIWYIVVKYGIL